MNCKSIIELRGITCDRNRGYKFEQAIRNLLPRDFNPPVPVQNKEHSEQLDGIFLWKNQAYLIEAKAKKKAITAGSHDWEDFELKITRRRNTVIGLFCSLYPIHKNVHRRAAELVNSGHLVIVLDGSFWDELVMSSLNVADVLDYMNIYGRSNLIASPPKLSIIENWRFNKSEIINKFSEICLDHSSILHGRHKSDNHDKLYINREAEKHIESCIKGLKPNMQNVEKEPPKQICLLRDFSGSGKTTISVHVSSMNDIYFGVGMTANEPSIDQKCFNFFKLLGDDYGIRELKIINKPILYIIDSLDEASSIAGKKNEVLAILRKIEKLNEKAAEYNLIAYPILFVFTLREDYWRDWESIFEGSKRHDINKRISCYSDIEFPNALKKYMSCYDYNIVNDLTEESLEILKRPINLLIFSETHQGKGEINVNEIWESGVIYNYFERKLDNISKRKIPDYNPQAYMNLLSDLAYVIVSTQKNILEYRQIVKIIEEKYHSYAPFCDEIVKVLNSEHILVSIFDRINCFRFRHSRFLEFLMAYYCLQNLRNKSLLHQKTRNWAKKLVTFQTDSTQKLNRDTNLLDEYIETAYNSGIVTIFRVHDDMRYICMKKYLELLAELDNYYSKSNIFMSRKISSLRYDLASSIKIQDDDISLILKNVNSRNPKLTIEAFFVIASKPCKQSSRDILNTFVISFKSMYNIPEQYKMILKLASNNLLCYEQVLSCIMISNYPKNWETYLGGIIDTMHGNYEDFKELWKQSNGDKKLEQVIKKSDLDAGEWLHVKKLLRIVLFGEEYVSGEI